MLKKIFIGGITLISILIGIIVYNKYAYVGEMVDPLLYFDEFKGNTYNLVYEDSRVDLEEPIIIKENEVLVRYDFANYYVSDRIYYDDVEKVMTLTNDQQVIRLHEGKNKVTYGDKTGEYTLYTNADDLYISTSLLQDLFEVTITPGKENNLFVATNHGKSQEVATVKKKVSLRTHPRNKSTVIEKIPKGSSVYVYEQADGFARVRSEEGIVGYIKADDLKNIQVIEAYPLPEVKSWEEDPLGEKVKLVWDQITNTAVVDWNRTKYKAAANANVIAPTWFEFKDEEGNLLSRATKGYVEQAHQRNLEVWPILSHNFIETSLTAKILSSTSKRQSVIDQIITYAKEYQFDGINIDIENVQVELSADWVQFIRELYPQLKKLGLTVSVDVYMPSAWSSHYEREKIGKSCDYFVVMAYDQHWSGSDKAGSVAEIPWVEQGILESIEEVPPHKLVLGIPFYARVWQEEDGKLSSKPYDMTTVKKLVTSWGTEPVLDANSGQYYAEVMKANRHHKVWIEDLHSITQRVDLIQKYDLAGFAAWKLGLETTDIWNVLNEVK